MAYSVNVTELSLSNIWSLNQNVNDPQGLIGSSVPCFTIHPSMHGDPARCTGPPRFHQVANDECRLDHVVAWHCAGLHLLQQDLDATFRSMHAKLYPLPGQSGREPVHFGRSRLSCSITAGVRSRTCARYPEAEFTLPGLQPQSHARLSSAQSGWPKSLELVALALSRSARRKITTVSAA